jgi:hypothetical protein
MTLPGELLYYVLENIMPRLFGGEAGDYQLCSTVNASGEMSYLLSVSPSLADIDVTAVRQGFLKAIADSGNSTFTSDFLDKAHQFGVVRDSTSLSSGGKSLPVILHRR